MNHTERIEELLSENELLQLQLGDLEQTLKKRDKEIGFLVDSTESTASLQSRIDNNLTEIEHLKAEAQAAAQKTLAAEMMNEELEVDIMRERKEKQRQATVIKNLGSVQTELEIITGELEEATTLYSKIAELQAELAETKSRADLLDAENKDLKAEAEELQALLKEIKRQKLT